MASSQGAEAPSAPGTPTKKSRRSWFDAPPLTSLDPPTGGKPEMAKMASKRTSIDTVETLILTHFTNPPKINFGKIMVGKKKFRTLILRNPHDFEQEVIIERFPFKKKFMVERTRFVVPAEDMVSLEITFSPEEAGGFREMIQFHINDFYRLQAFIIGVVEKPKPPRKVRKFPMGGRFREPPSVLQTPALSSIKSSYSPRRSEEVREMLEDLDQINNKENSRELVSQGNNYDTKVIVQEHCLKTTAGSSVKVEFGAEVRASKIFRAEEECFKTPTPLESTALTGLHDKGQLSQKNRRQWRNISDITSPTLNTMSPIPHTEDNEYGITVDSYFQPNDTRPERLSRIGKENEHVGKAVKESHSENLSDALKKTFVVPFPRAKSEYTKINSKEQEGSEDMTSEICGESQHVSDGERAQKKAIVDETRVIRRDEVTSSPSIAEAEQTKTGIDAVVRSRSNFMEANRRDDRSSPTIQKKTLGVCDMVTSPASPGTILNQSLNLISQMKLHKASDGSPTDPNQSMNCSLISLGQGIVSPNSFVEDMRSMRHDLSGGSGGSVNTSTPLIPSPLSVLNNSIPHSVMVSHLNKIRSSLNSPHIGGSSGGSTPVKQAALKRCPKRRSITSQFKKEEIKKLAMVAAAMDKHGNGLANSGQVKYLLRKDQIENKNNVCKAPSPRQALFVKKTKAVDARKLESSKRSPTGKRLNKRSPIAKPFFSRRSPKRVKQEPTMKRVKSKCTSEHHHTQDSSNSKSEVNLKVPDFSCCESEKISACSSSMLTQETTPIKEQSMDIPKQLVLSAHPGTVVHSGTVVKAKSGECLEESIKYFDDLQADPESSANRNSSLTRRGKLFPDIEVSNLSDVIVGEEESCLQEASESEISSGSKKTSEKPTDARSSRLQRVVSAIERSMSPQRFCPLSPGDLPTSPGAELEHSRRGTITVVKSRPSDALLAAMNNRKRLFAESPHRTPAFCINEDDTETQEKIQVRVEEHYEEINGEMFLVVKETTDVVKSTTETYIEQLVVSPRHFQTPPRLPNSPDPQMTRRSTHVVHSPKVLNVLEMDHRRLDFQEDFIKYKLSGDIEMDDSTNRKGDARHYNVDSSSDTSKLNLEDHTRLKRYVWEDIEGDKSPITSVGLITPKIVDYDVGSDGCSSGDITKDSLETSQTTDSLNQSSAVVSNADGSNSKSDDPKDSNGEGSEYSTPPPVLISSICSCEPVPSISEYHHDPEPATSESFLVPVSYNRQSIKPDQTPITENISSVARTNSATGATTCEVYSTGAREPLHNPVPITHEESEEENFYDTQSERYYDAMSDTMGTDIDEEIQELTLQGNNREDSCNLDHMMFDKKQIAEAYGENLQSLALKLKMNTDREQQESNICSRSPSAHLENQRQIREEYSIDHQEHFIVTEKDVFEAKLVEAEAIAMGKMPEALEDKRKLRRSISVDGLLQTVITDLPQKPATGGGKLGDHSKFDVFAKPKAVTLKNSQTKASKGQPLRPAATISQRSQSMTNLAKKVDKTKSPQKATLESTLAKVPVKSVPQVNRGNIKQRGPTRGVAQSRLILVKKPKTGTPRHPMPFAARNMYYDERWVEKQERGFVQWLNFVLTPPDEYVAVTTKAKVDAHSLALDNRQVAPRLAPTKEILSFRAYAARRRLNRLRRAACELYQSEPIVNIICKIEVEVESRRLAVRKDKMVHADLGVKQRLLDLLLQYSSLWLRIGLETIFGEVVMLQSNTDVVGLSRFIVTRLLASPDIAAQFAHPTVPHLYKEGYAAALSRHTIKKFLLLVYFLDQAKSSHLIDHDPCLFCKDADIKSSKEILIEFSREVLSGEGDLTRHLAYLGYIVTQSQRSIDEFDFAVKTLSADLRDGLRLSRIIELLAGNKTIMSKLRTPAISLLQKQHNVKLFFEAMAERKMDLSKSQVTPKDIVDGHREKTLLLLWHLIIHFQCSIKVNMDHLKEEIDMLIKSLQLKLAMQKVGVLSKEGCQARRDSGGTQLLMENERLQLIFQWCRLVCLHYGVTVENFTVSFSDGRALCCLIHHYHPALLPLSEIKFHTTVSFQQAAEDQCQVVIDPDSSMDWGHGGGLMANENNPEMFEELLANEKANFKTLYEKVSELGGVPLMLRCADMSNTIPDEKVVSTYVSYMCARLLDIREEVKAARIIQMFWRRRQLKHAVKKRELRTKAAITIQRWIRLHITKMSSERQEKAAVCLQTLWRGYLARREASRLKEHEQIAKLRLLREQAAVILQCLWRSRCARCQLAKLKVQNQERVDLEEREKAAVVLQKFVRACRTRREFERKRFAVLTIQAVWRRLIAEKRVHQLRLELHERSALTIQKWMKRYLCMKRLSSMQAAALVIQKNWRTLQAKKQLYHLKVDQQNKAAILIQKVIRGRILERQFKKMRHSTLVLQTYWRVKQAKKELARLRNEKTNGAAILIQSVMKRVAAQKLFLKKRRAAIVLQKHWRRAMAKKELDSLKLERNNQSCTIVQSFLKSAVHRQAFLRKKRAAIILQKNWRRALAKRELSNNRNNRIAKAATTVQGVMKSISCRKIFLRKKHAATVLQKHWRRVLAQKKLSGLKAERLDRAATLVQCALKAFAQRKLFLRKRDSALTLQKNWRRTLAQREAAHLRTLRDTRAAVTVQKFWRGWRVKKEFISLKRSAVVVQGAWRVCLAKRECERLVAIRHTECATVIQRTFRSYLHRKEFQKLRSAAEVIQKTWKMQLAKRELKRLRGLRQEQAAVTIQKYYRGHRSKKSYLLMRWAAIGIQKYWRMLTAVRAFNKLKHAEQVTAAIHIQRVYRGWKSRRCYLVMRSAAITFQRAWKLVQKHRQLEKLKAEKWCKAAILIQKSWKGFIAREAFVEKKRATVVLQALFRMVEAKQRYSRTQQATLIIQDWYRANLLATKQRSEFLRKRQVAILIQKWWRCKSQRQRYCKMVQAAVVIQSAFRCYRRRIKFLALKLATIIVQRGYRNYRFGRKIRQQYLSYMQATVTVQRTWRRLLTDRQEKRVAAAVLIQKAFRRRIALKKFVATKRAVLVIQNHYREYKKTKNLRQAFLEKKQAVSTIQYAFRAYKLRQEYKHVCCLIVKIQAFIRGHQTRKRYLQQRHAAITIQRKYRATISGRVLREQFLLIKSSAVTLQSFYRSVLVRREMQRQLCIQELAATKVQALFRGWSHRQDFLFLRAATVCCQRRFRALLAGKAVRRELETMKRSVRLIEKTWRSFSSIREAKRKLNNLRLEKERELKRRQEEERLEAKRKEERERLEVEKKVEEMRRERAAGVLQRCIRAYLKVRDWERKEAAAVMIQKYVRSYSARLKYKRCSQSVLLLQCRIKGFVYRRRYERMLLASTIIQRRWREILDGRLCRKVYLTRRDVIVKIQTMYRMKCQRQRYLCDLRKIIRLQACIRALILRKKYFDDRGRVIWMQRTIRCKQQMKRDRHRYLTMRESVVKIQTVLRVWLAYRKMVKEKSVIKIQAHLRMLQERSAFVQTNCAVQVLTAFIALKQQQVERRTQEAAACIIQQAFRGYLRRQAETRHHAACVIQRTFHLFILRTRLKKLRAALVIYTAFKTFVARRHYLALKQSVILIQSAIRGWLARKVANELRKKQKNIIFLQAAARGYLTRKKVRPLINERLNIMQEKKRRMKASTKIQSLWRGFVTRRDSKNKRLAQARKRLQGANQSSSSKNTLGFRTTFALDQLLRERDLAYILEALSHLEVSTRLSPVCCEMMVKGNAVRILYRLINSCNRSVPHMELIKYAVTILLNLAKYEKTVDAVMDADESIATILELLCIYREKGPIFFNSCMLLGILGLKEERRKIILQHPQIVENLQSIYALTLRKQKLNKTREVTQAKLALTKSFNYTMPIATPSKSKHRKINPQWVLKRDNIKDFEDPLSAVNFVMNVLQIGPKT